MPHRPTVIDRRGSKQPPVIRISHLNPGEFFATATGSAYLLSDDSKTLPTVRAMNMETFKIEIFSPSTQVFTRIDGTIFLDD